MEYAHKYACLIHTYTRAVYAFRLPNAASGEAAHVGVCVYRALALSLGKPGLGHFTSVTN